LLLDHGANVNASFNALKICAINDYYHLIKLLLEYGVDVHANNDEAFRESIHNNSVNVVKLLLENGADIHINDNDNILYAQSLDMIEVLVEYGSDIHLQDDQLLRQNVFNGNVETVRFLLESGANGHVINDSLLNNVVLEMRQLLLDFGR